MGIHNHGLAIGIYHNQEQSKGWNFATTNIFYKGIDNKVMKPEEFLRNVGYEELYNNDQFSVD